MEQKAVSTRILRQTTLFGELVPSREDRDFPTEGEDASSQRKREREEGVADPCSVCLDDIWSGCISALPCGHRIHTSCFVSLTNRSCPVHGPRCPICRGEIINASEGMEPILEPSLEIWDHDPQEKEGKGEPLVSIVLKGERLLSTVWGDNSYFRNAVVRLSHSAWEVPITQFCTSYYDGDVGDEDFRRDVVSYDDWSRAVTDFFPISTNNRPSNPRMWSIRSGMGLQSESKGESFLKSELKNKVTDFLRYSSRRYKRLTLAEARPQPLPST